MEAYDLPEINQFVQTARFPMIKRWIRDEADHLERFG